MNAMITEVDVLGFLGKAQLMQIATLTERGTPRVCSVWYGFDENLNMYFFSATTRNHSKDLESDNRIAGAIALPCAPDDPPQGVQFAGSASLLTDEVQIKTARQSFENRIFSAEKIDSLMANADRQHRFYKITPANFKLMDAVNFPNNSPQEFSL
jgi:uncharacterized protein YhbP (UPF0306 family)